MRQRYVMLALLAFSLVLCSFPAVKAEARRDVGVSAESAILYHPASGSVLYEKNADDRRGIASTTKIVTALTVLKRCGDLDRTVTIPQEACGVEGSSLYLKPGEKLTVIELLYGLLLASANDAATALAIACAGSVEAFADKMNGIAAEYGLLNSHFSNPHGLDAKDHYSTARDLATVAAAALEDETFREIVSTKRSVIDGDCEPRYLHNHNKLLDLYPGCVGVKTGYTKKCGRCLVSAAERDGELLIAVTLNAPNDWNDHRSMLDQGFSQLEKRTLLTAGEYEIELPVVNGNCETVRVSNLETVELAIPKDSPSPERAVKLPRFLAAPLFAGEIVGYVEYRLNGKTVGASPLIVRDAVREIKYKKGFFHL